MFGFPLLMNASTMTLSLSLRVEEPMSLEVEDEREEKPALVPSLFPHFPSTLYFSTTSEKGEDTHSCKIVSSVSSQMLSDCTEIHILFNPF